MLDAVFLIAGVFTFVVQQGNFLLPGLIASLLLFIYADLSIGSEETEQGSGKLKGMLLLGIILTTVVAATWQQIELRHIGGKPAEHVHDHILQMESSVTFLLVGKNPYAMSFKGTPLELWWNDDPALEHVIALPFTFLKSVPVYLVWNGLFHWYDDRIAQLLLFGIALGALWFLYKTPTFKLLAITVFVFNPLFARFFIEGRGDIVFLSLLFASLACLRWKYVQASLLLLTLAVVSKHTAWFIVPFFFTYLASQQYFAKDALRKLLPSIVLGLLIVGPFLLWDWHSFFDDVYSYPAGTIPTSYPISGYGLAKALNGIGLIPDVHLYFPAILLQLFLLPLLYLLMRDVYRRPSIGRMMVYYGAFLWPFWFLSRFLNDNYLGVLIAIFALGLLLMYDEGKVKPVRLVS